MPTPPATAVSWFTRAFSLGSQLKATQIVTGGFVLLLVGVLVRGEQDRGEWTLRLDRIDERNRVHTEAQMREHWEFAATLERLAVGQDRLLAMLVDWLLGREPKKPQSGVKTQPTSTTAGPGTTPAPAGSKPEH